METFRFFAENFIVVLFYLANILIIGVTLWEVRPISRKELLFWLPPPVIVLLASLHTSFSTDGTFDPYTCAFGVFFATLLVVMSTRDRTRKLMEAARQEAERTGEEAKPLPLQQVIHGLFPLVLLAAALLFVSM